MELAGSAHDERAHRKSLESEQFNLHSSTVNPAKRGMTDATIVSAQVNEVSR